MTTPLPPLDIATVQAFVHAADFGSFTRAAEAMKTSQAAISLKLKRLEDRLGRRLLQRTPRQVRLSQEGEAFMPAARELLAAHERAVADAEAATPRRLVLGISHHVAGRDLPVLLGPLTAHDPLVVVEVRIAGSRELLVAFDRRECDAVIVRPVGDRSDGEVLMEERFGWFASPLWKHRQGEPLRLATMAAPCGVRATATQVLDQAGIAWTEVFVGGGVLAVGAAVTAGLGVAALARRVAPVGSIDIGDQLGLPPLPASEVMLHTRLTDRRLRDTLRALTAGLKSAAQR
jgi:DNA-binding transcriptional LysR family regulator